MGLIYGGIRWDDILSGDKVAQLKSDLEDYPSDEHDFVALEKCKVGLFSIRLRTPPFPQEKIISDDGLTLVADVRLDYRDELVEKLGFQKDSINDHSDTALLYQAYLKWGKECVNYIEGDYVFLIHDAEKKEVWGARDPIGLRQLFFTQKDSTLYFSTSSKGLIDLDLFPKEANEKFWLNRLLKTECLPSTTQYNNVFQIPIGCTITLNNDGFKSCLLYTSPSPRDKRQSRMPSSA